MCQTTNQILALYNSSNSPTTVFSDVAECCIVLVVATRNVRMLGPKANPKEILFFFELCLGTPHTFDGLPPKMD